MSKIEGTRRLKIYTIDSFTSVPFSGNPAAVCLDDTEGLSDELMQKIAAEMNISETAFVRNLEETSSFEKGEEFGLRWFTPTVEVPLCGHATLATAAIFVNIIGNKNKELKFKTKSGILTTKTSGTKIVLDLPLNSPSPVDKSQFADVIKAVVGDLEVEEVLKTQGQFPGLVVRLADKYSRSDLVNLGPDFQWFQTANNSGHYDGVMVTLRGRPNNGCQDDQGEELDFVSRFFAPWLGIPEDPATGAAHTVLAPYWSQVLDKNSLVAYQCSERGGQLWMTLRGDRLEVAGHAALVLQGTINY